MTSAFQRTKSNSDKALADLRAALGIIVPAEAVALTCGSYARREATSGSDLDFFILSPSEADYGTAEQSPQWFAEAGKAITQIVAKPPAAGGAFDAITKMDELLAKAGGDRDINKTITRRMLYLLEGEYLTNKVKFQEIRRKIITMYVEETPHDHQIALYLLNDVIRYWRTMTVDYSYKTTEGGKSWALRNIKLVFSRKLIYASGLFSIAMTADRTLSKKVEKLEELFSMAPLDRLNEICGLERVRRLRESYDFFLDRIDTPAIRLKLEELTKDQKDHDVDYRALKNEGHRFTRELMSVFEATFHTTHPIYRAVVF